MLYAEETAGTRADISQSNGNVHPEDPKEA